MLGVMGALIELRQEGAAWSHREGSTVPNSNIIKWLRFYGINEGGKRDEGVHLLPALSPRWQQQCPPGRAQGKGGEEESGEKGEPQQGCLGNGGCSCLPAVGFASR